MLILALIGCRTESSVSECVTTRYAVDDDELAADFTVTAADVLDVVLGPFSFTAAYDDGTSVAGEGEVVRGGGHAMVTDGTIVTHTQSSGFGFEKQGPIPTSELTCHDLLEVPVDVTLGTDDGAVELSFDGVALPLVTRADGVPDLFEVTGDIDPADVVAFPDAPDPDAQPGLALQWEGDGFHWASLWWRGADYVQILEGGPAE